VRGLAPDSEAQDYQLWFIVDGIPLNGGVFDAKAGQVAGLAASTMPAGATAVAITLEKKGGVSAPTTPILLIASEAVRI
jgi:anti-sigma-K factor RskA